MLLQPRKFIWKQKQKKRSFRPYRRSELNYGDAGLLILKPLTLTAKRLFRFKLYLKKATKRSDFTRRRIWFNAFPHLPLTRKSKGTRMGKGVGKLANWVAYLKSGSYLFELKNLRPGRSRYFLKQLAYRLPVCSVPVLPAPKNLRLLGMRRTNPLLLFFILLWYGYIYYMFFFVSLFALLIFFYRLLYLNLFYRLNFVTSLLRYALNFFIFFSFIALLVIYCLLDFGSTFSLIILTDPTAAVYLDLVPTTYIFDTYLFSLHFLNVYAYPFIYIFILITLISILFCLAYNFTEILSFMFYCTLILLSGYVLFFTDSLILFFLSYEMLLIPSFFILYNFAKTRRCVEAAYLMFFWTQFGAMFLIFSFLYLFTLCGTSTFSSLTLLSLSPFEINFLFFTWLVGFGVKLPVWPFYGWLPKAHVEASTNFSIFLSGVLVKFAFFGLLKCLTALQLEPTFYYVYPFLAMGIFDAVFKLFYQIDLKKLVAYSTVVEMHWLTFCIISGHSPLLLAGFCMLISHALLSTNSFLLVDAIGRRFKTRLLTEINGVNFLCPKLFFISLLNLLVFLGFPGSIMFVAEILFFTFTLDLFPLLTLILLVLLYLLGPTFFFRSWTNVLFGSSSFFNKNVPNDLFVKEFLLYYGLILLMFWFGLTWQALIF